MDGPPIPVESPPRSRLTAPLLAAAVYGLEQGRTLEQVAQQLEVRRASLSAALRELGFPTRSAAPPKPTKRQVEAELSKLRREGPRSAAAFKPSAVWGDPRQRYPGGPLDPPVEQAESAPPSPPPATKASKARPKGKGDVGLKILPPDVIPETSVPAAAPAAAPAPAAPAGEAPGAQPRPDVDGDGWPVSTDLRRRILLATETAAQRLQLADKLQRITGMTDQQATRAVGRLCLVTKLTTDSALNLCKALGVEPESIWAAWPTAAINKAVAS